MINKTYVKISKNGCAPCNAINQFLKGSNLNQDNVIKVSTPTLAQSVIKGELETGKMYEVLVDEFPEVAGHFELSSVPVILEVVEGKVVYQISGFSPPYLEEIINNLK